MAFFCNVKKYGPYDTICYCDIIGKKRILVRIIDTKFWVFPSLTKYTGFKVMICVMQHTYDNRCVRIITIIPPKKIIRINNSG